MRSTPTGAPMLCTDAANPGARLSRTFQGIAPRFSSQSCPRSCPEVGHCVEGSPTPLNTLALLVVTLPLQCTWRESNPGHKHERHIRYHYTTCAWSISQSSPLSLLLIFLISLIFLIAFLASTKLCWDLSGTCFAQGGTSSGNNNRRETVDS